MSVDNEQSNGWSPNHDGISSMVRSLIADDGLNKRLSELGFTSVMDFVENYPGETYYELANRIGTRPIFLTRAHGFEAVEKNLVRQFSVEAFVREMRDALPNGWIHKKGSSLERRTIVAISFLDQELANASAPPSAIKSADRMWKALLELDPPLGWLPEDINDPLIQKAFAIGWPDEDSSE